MIASFADVTTESLFHGGPRKDYTAVPPSIQAAALRQLDLVNAAMCIEDLQAQRSQSVRTLRGKRSFRLRIKLEEHWELLLRWQGSEAFECRLAQLGGKAGAA